jgi:hypothetical protein
MIFFSILNLTCREASIPSMTLIVGANLLKGRKLINLKISDLMLTLIDLA